MRSGIFLLTSFIGLLAASGCSHISYGQAHVDGNTTEYAEFAPERPVQTYQLVLHEFHLYDRTGGFCAGMLESGGKAAAEIDERREMAKDGRMTGEYEWKTYDPAQFNGIECGLFYRYGQGTGGGVTDYSTIPPYSATSPTGRFTYEEGEHSLHELGLHIGGQGYFDYGFLWRFEFRITGGSLDLVTPNLVGPGRMPKEEEGSGFFTIPTRVAIGFAPDYLFGLGAMAWGGIELAQWLANYGEERDSIIDYFDYGAGAMFVADTPYVRPSLYFGWLNNHIYWNDRVATHKGLEGRVALDLVWEDF